jgi:RNA methyltransferase, TrmH family
MLGSRAPLGDSNARLAAARRLTRRPARRETGLFLAEGAQAVLEALTRPDVVVEVFATAHALERYGDLLAAVRVDEVSERAAAGLSETVAPQGLVAVCNRVDVSLTAALERAPRLVAVLVEPNDPGNAGAILRTADAAGADAVVLAGGVDIYNGKAVRASAGSLFHLDVVVDVPIAEVIAAGHAAGLTVFATTSEGAHDLDELSDKGTLARPTMWLFGTEAHGLPEEVIDAAEMSVRVPIHGRAESLNVAAAAAVCLYASARAHRRG